MKKLLFILLAILLVGCQAKVVEEGDNSLNNIVEKGKMIVGFTE